MDQELNDRQKSQLGELSREPFGMDLARRVTKYLKNQGSIAYNHRDYCGTGLFFLNGRYLHAAVDDGHPVVFWAEERGWSFGDPHAFAQWLAAQSDYSLSMYDNPQIFNNQTISRKRLEEVLGDL